MEKPTPSLVTKHQVSDHIRDSKLETVFDGDVIRHIPYISDVNAPRRRVRREVKWER